MSAEPAHRPTRLLPTLPALVPGVVTHRRSGAVDHAFSHRLTLWLVEIPARAAAGRRGGAPALHRGPLRLLADIRPGDHLDDATRPTREAVAAQLADHGLTLERHDRVVLLAGVRSFGHLFDPLSVFWCLQPSGRVRAVVAEVHNTYGERHSYVLTPDDRGRAQVDKAFYVSPFYEVDGHYRLRFELSAQQVRVAVSWRPRTDDHAPGSDADRPTDPQSAGHAQERRFHASFEGVPRAATPRAVLAEFARRPFMAQRVSALIRVHGVWLWLRRLPVLPRPGAAARRAGPDPARTPTHSTPVPRAAHTKQEHR